MLPNIPILGHTVPSYTILGIAGIILAVFYCLMIAGKTHMNVFERAVYLLFCVVFAMLGAALLYQLTVISYTIKILPYLFTDFTYFKNNFPQGIVYYGGLIGIYIGAWVYSKTQHEDTRLWLYQCIPAIPLFHIFGRVGCALAGCCYGREVDEGGIWNTVVGHRCIPIQLYEACGNALIFAVLISYLIVNQRQIKVRRKKASIAEALPMPNPYATTGLYLVLYGIMRFTLEFWRGDAIRGIIGGLSTSQWISLVLVPIGFYCLIIPSEKNILNHLYNGRRSVKNS